MTVAVVIIPAVTVTVANTRSANYGASCAANHCADRTRDNRAGSATDCGARNRRSVLLAALAIAGRAVSAAKLATIRSLRIVSSKV